MHQGLSEPEFYGDLVYKFKKIEGRADFSDQFRKIIVRYKRIGYNINIMRQSACLVFNPITGVRLNDCPDIELFILVGWGRSFFVRYLAHRGSTVGFLLLQCFLELLDTPEISSPPYFNTDRSKAVLLLWFLTVTCSCCPYLYFGSAIMLVTYFSLSHDRHVIQ